MKTLNDYSSLMKKIISFEQDCENKEPYFTNIINEDKSVLETLEQKECKILRRNIEDFYNEESIKKEWEESIRDFLSAYLTF